MKYSGFVYDKNGNALQGIRVSDGRNVCVTDENGFYSLDGWERDVLIFCNILTNSHNDWFSIISKEKTTYDYKTTSVSVLHRNHGTERAGPAAHG
jgi:hypothetical protein